MMSRPDESQVRPSRRRQAAAGRSWPWFVVPAAGVALVATVAAIAMAVSGGDEGADDTEGTVRAGPLTADVGSDDLPTDPILSEPDRPRTSTVTDLIDAPGPFTAELTVRPSVVIGHGPHEFTVTGEGWTAAPPIFVVPCGAELRFSTIDDRRELSPGDLCDTSNLTPATPVDGAFEVTVTYEGLAVAAGDAGQTQAAVAYINAG